MALFIAPLVTLTDPVVELTEEDGVTPLDPPQFSEPETYRAPGVVIEGNWSGIPLREGVDAILIYAPDMATNPPGTMGVPDDMTQLVTVKQAETLQTRFELTNAQRNWCVGKRVGRVLMALMDVQPTTRNKRRILRLGEKLIHEEVDA